MRTVQACHACLELACQKATCTWLSPGDEHPRLVLLGEKSEQRLRLILYQLRQRRIACAPFYEPDRDNELTAIATVPLRGDDRKFFKRFQCLRE